MKQESKALVTGAAEKMVAFVSACERELTAEVVEGKDKCGIGLKQPVAFQSVEIDASDAWHLVGLVALLANYGSQCAYFSRCHVEFLGFSQTLVIPELVVFLLHAVNEFLRVGVPIELVGVGDEEGGDGVGVESQSFDVFLVVKQ